VSDDKSEVNAGRKKILETGCGCGNLLFPLIEDKSNNYFIYCCDFSPRAIQLVKENPLYNEERMKAFQCDITNSEALLSEIPEESIDVITMVFVLSAIHPEKFQLVASNLFKLLKKNGILLFRDYGLYDMAQIRFKAGSKIGEKFYVRQDGTRSYFFSLDETKELFESVGFETKQNSFVERRTINVKENVDVKRRFVQGKYLKPMR
jgi:methyltransferase-like protein 6